MVLKLDTLFRVIVLVDRAKDAHIEMGAVVVLRLEVINMVFWLQCLEEVLHIYTLLTTDWLLSTNKKTIIQSIVTCSKGTSSDINMNSQVKHEKMNLSNELSN